MLDILLVRHALCDTAGRSLAGRQPGVSLNATGRSQATQLAQQLRPLPLAAVYSGPLERARETAAAIALTHNLTVTVDDRFDEIDFGEWTGRSLSELEGEIMWRQFNELRSLTRIPGGEHMLETQQRVLAGIDSIRVRYDAGAVVIVTHCDVIRSTLAHLLGMPLDLMLRFDVTPASVSAVRYDGAWPRVISVNATLPSERAV